MKATIGCVLPLIWVLSPAYLLSVTFFNKNGWYMETIDKIKEQISENPILLYMKGSPKLPSCGFSSQASQALMGCEEQFAYVDILQNPDIRAELPKFANWPTFPQLWVDGELVGGCDIIMEMFQQGELQTLIKETAVKHKPAE